MVQPISARLTSAHVVLVNLKTEWSKEDTGLRGGSIFLSSTFIFHSKSLRIYNFRVHSWRIKMSSRRDEARNKEIPDVVVDPSSNKKYMKGKFLGKVWNMSVQARPVFTVVVDGRNNVTIGLNDHNNSHRCLRIFISNTNCIFLGLNVIANRAKLRKLSLRVLKI